MNRNANALAGPSDTPLYMLSGDQLSLEMQDGFLEVDRFAGAFGPDPVTFVAHSSTAPFFRRTCVFTVRCHAWRAAPA